MPFIEIDRENKSKIELYFEDHGTGDPVVLIHGWPLSGASWEKQVPALLRAGYRVITYDRRGFGKSGKPAFGYDYNTLSRDLDALIRHLDLKNVTLVGFSMGGGEVARYVSTFGTDRVKRAVFVSAVPPFLLRQDDNPAGVDMDVFEGLRDGLLKDRPAFLSQFFKQFYNLDRLRDKRISIEAVDYSWLLASEASPIGSVACVASWLSDFRADLRKFSIPTLVVHGTADQIVPFESSGKRMPEFIPGARLVQIDEAPHGLNLTHAAELNEALLSFLKGSVRRDEAVAPGLAASPAAKARDPGKSASAG